MVTPWRILLSAPGFADNEESECVRMSEHERTDGEVARCLTLSREDVR